MKSNESERVKAILIELDTPASKEDAAVVFRYDTHHDQVYLVANRQGFFRLGIECFAAFVESAGRDGVTSVRDTDYLVHSDVDAGFGGMCLDENVMRLPPVNKTAGGDKRIVFTVLLVLLLMLILSVVGAVTIFRWFL